MSRQHDRRGWMLGLLGGEKIRYLLRDDFTGLLTNGNVSGTPATPGPGTRATVDVAATIQIAVAGTLKIVGGGNNTDLFALDTQTRAAGLAIAYKFTLADADADAASRRIGFDPDHLVLVASDTSMTTKFGGQLGNGTYYTIIVLRAAGADCYFKGGAFAEWTLVDRQIVGSTATLTPIAKIYQFARNFYINTIRALNLSWLASPVASDGFGGTFGTTDGLGHAEGVAGGIGIGGSGLTYTQIGTWANAIGTAACGTLDAGIGKAVVDGGVVDVLHEATITRTAGTMGVIVRWADADNYVYAYILNDGNNKATLRKVVGGVDSEVIAPTNISYAAAKVLRIQAFATKFRLFYNNVLIGTEQTIADAGLQTGTKVGLFTTDSGNTFDNMQTLSMVDTEYDSKFKNFFPV